MYYFEYGTIYGGIFKFGFRGATEKKYEYILLCAQQDINLQLLVQNSVLTLK